MTLYEIESYLDDKGIDYEAESADDRRIEGFCPLNGLKEKCITWVRHAEDTPVDALNHMKGIVLIAEKGQEIKGLSIPVIYAVNAHRTFFRVIEHFFQDQDMEKRETYIAPTAVIESKEIGDGLYVGHHTYIGPDVILGSHVTILHNVTIQGKVTIGDHTVIESGVTIGVCGYGHYWDEEGNPVTVPHLAGVSIGEHVRIGANSVVCRGCLSDTVIGDYVRIDNLCNISHNDHIKRGAMLAAGSIISGSTDIGKDTWIAPGSVLNNAITIGDNAFLGIGSVASKSVPGGKCAAGVPARVYKDR